ncbi:MAG: radical SAM protein [Bacteroidota bacterium]
MNNSGTINRTLIEVSNNNEQHKSQFHVYAHNKLLTGYRLKWCHFNLKIGLLKIIMGLYRNPKHWIGAFRYLVQLRKQFLGDFELKKMVIIDGKYYMGLYTPGFNNEIYKRFISSELNLFKKNSVIPLRFNHVYVAVTKKCPLQCDHCYAWEMLNQKEQLSPEDLKSIIDKLQRLGTAQVHLTGGEPLIKPDLLLSLLRSAENTTNFWINTSGYKLTTDRARALKEAGLTGLFISLDHFEAEAHNVFRKYKDAFYWATEGAKNAIRNGLVVAFSLCLRNDFVTEENLMTYMELAKELKVPFVQFLEPRDVGHYSGKDVSLSIEKIKLLESFYERMNFSDLHLDFPIINYHGYYQRRQGCYAGGNRSMYIDTDGNLNACPFCHTNSGNILDDDFEFQLNAMTAKGCPTY